MATWPESLHHNSVEFRAPPPSPIASGRRSSVANDEFLTEFLHHSLRVPDLILPDRISPRQKSKIQNLPKLDYRFLDSIEGDVNAENCEVIARTGCFELVNHGISDQLVRYVSSYGAGIFELSPERKAVMSRSGDRMYGFVEFYGDEKETCEEFVWCRDDAFRKKLDAVLPLQISNFSENVEILTSEIEKICGIILKFLLNNTRGKSLDDAKASEKRTPGSVCYFYKHHQDPNTNHNENHQTNSLKYDMIRMLIRGSQHSHTLCVHVCTGSEFHVYSKKGLVSFCPEKGALVITIGDQLQRWSEGRYKHVMGRPGEGDECVSMAFMYNPPPVPVPVIISIGHQALFVLILALVYKFYCVIN
ncbi:putative gibberellin 3-beta-dioxygenase [Helianthus annuus]|nr:putative gibberellin 3-beta-dioxygenase [Helianthus annuus]